MSVVDAAAIMARCDELAAVVERPRRDRARLPLPRARPRQRAWPRDWMERGRHAHLAGRGRQPVRPLRGPRRRGCPRCCSARTSTPCPTRAATTGSSACCSAIAVVCARSSAAGTRLPFAARGRRVRRRGGHPLRHGPARLPRGRRHLGRALVGRWTDARRHDPARGVPRVRPRPRRASATAARDAGRRSSATSRRTSSRARTWRRRTAPLGVVSSIAGRPPLRS